MNEIEIHIKQESDGKYLATVSYRDGDTVHHHSRVVSWRSEGYAWAETLLYKIEPSLDDEIEGLR